MERGRRAFSNTPSASKAGLPVDRNLSAAEGATLGGGASGTSLGTDAFMAVAPPPLHIDGDGIDFSARHSAPRLPRRFCRPSFTQYRTRGHRFSPGGVPCSQPRP
jgi:hypothetical protein